MPTAHRVASSHSRRPRDLARQMPELPQAERARRLVDALCVVAVVRDVRRPLVDDKVFVDVEEGWFKRALEERATATPRRDDSNRWMRDGAQMTIEKRARSTLIGGGCGAGVRHATTLARSTRASRGTARCTHSIVRHHRWICTGIVRHRTSLGTTDASPRTNETDSSCCNHHHHRHRHHQRSSSSHPRTLDIDTKQNENEIRSHPLIYHPRQRSLHRRPRARASGIGIEPRRRQTRVERFPPGL